MRKPFVGAFSGIVLGLAITAQAFAHANYDRSDPAAGAAVTGSPPAVTIWYSEGIQQQDSWIHVLDANGRRVDMNDPVVQGDEHDQLSVHLQSGLPGGVYTVSWQNLSEDGDGLTGSFMFGVGVAPAGGN